MFLHRTQKTGRDELRRASLQIATLSSFLTPFMGSAVNIALPSIGRDFSMGAVALAWISTAFLLAAAVCLVPVGRIADIYGRKMIFFTGALVFTAATSLCALAASPGMLIACRFFQGVGSAMIFGTGTAILVSVFSPQERGRVLGINVAAVYLGLSLGPFAGGLLTEYGGWRTIFLITVPPGIYLLFLVRWKLKEEWKDAAGENFDVFGSILYGLAVVALIYGASVPPGGKGTALLFAGIVLLSLFILRERKTAHPILDVNLFRRNRVFAYSNIAALINYSATFAVSFLLSLYLQFLKGFSPLHSGLILASQPVMMSLFSPAAGSLSDRFEPQLIASSGMALTFAGLLALVFIAPDTSLLYIIGTLVVLGIGFGLFSSPNTNAVMGSVEKNAYGVASGILATMRIMGQTASMAVVMLIFSLFMGQARITTEHHPYFLSSMKTILGILTFLCFLGIFASMARGRMRGPSGPDPGGKESPGAC